MDRIHTMLQDRALNQDRDMQRVTPEMRQNDLLRRYGSSTAPDCHLRTANRYVVAGL